jgi:hypothetical protein
MCIDKFHQYKFSKFPRTTLTFVPGADFVVFGADRLVFPLSGADFRVFGADRLVFPLCGADFAVFGADRLPGLRRGGRGSATG